MLTTTAQIATLFLHPLRRCGDEFMKKFYGFALMAMLLSGCGYTLVGQGNLPEHINTIAIPVFQNETLQEGIEETLTNAVIQEFVKGGKVKLVSETKADAILSGTIRTYKNKEAVEFENEDDKTDATSYKLPITIDVELKDLVEDAVLWETEGLSENADYEGGSQISATEEEDNEKEALEDISKELAGKIRTLSTEGF